MYFFIKSTNNQDSYFFAFTEEGLAFQYKWVGIQKEDCVKYMWMNFFYQKKTEEGIESGNIKKCGKCHLPGHNRRTCPN